MPADFVDLHIHTTLSDGKYSPEDIFKTAAKKGLRAIAITDHDYCSSFDRISELAEQYELETVAGVEISTSYGGKDVHMLAYGVDPTYRPLQEELQKIRESRENRAEKIIENLKTMFDLPIEFEDVLAVSKTNIARPHISAALIKKKIAKNEQEAFVKYLNNESPAYVQKRKLDAIEAIKLICNANGLPVLAHFGRYYNLEMLEEFRQAGLAGIEIQHPSHTLKLKTELELYCKKHHLLQTGGSDFHTERTRYGGLGSQNVPYLYFEKITEKLKMSV